MICWGLARFPVWKKTSVAPCWKITWAGAEPIELDSGESRTFLEDGDTVTLRGACKGDGFTIGFGDCTGKILPAVKFP